MDYRLIIPQFVRNLQPYENRNPHVRLRTIRDHVNNNLIERYHGTNRERDKVMRGLQNEKTTEQYNDNFRTYYNFVKKHMTLKGMTPAQKAGIEEVREWKPFRKKSLSADTRQPKGDSR